MADEEEPQFTTLAQRMAALNSKGVGKSLMAPSTSAKRPPPPPPPSGNRPALPSRPQTTNNPPLFTYNSSVSKQNNNEPIGVRGQALLPPPPVDRDQPRPATPGRTHPLPARKGPPPLPSRNSNSSQLSPALPPRRPSNQLVRRGSNESTMSTMSTISGLSLGQNSSRTSTSSVDNQRKLPPALGEAKLPPLPPSRRELAEKTKNTQIPLGHTKSASAVPLRQPPPIDRDQPPKMPPRPSQAPQMPARPRSSNQQLAIEDAPPKQPPRRLPPPGATKSILSMGFGNKKAEEAPEPGPRPGPRPAQNSYNAPRPQARFRAGAVQQLTASNFDSTIRGKFAMVDFYAPYCKYCVELEPIWIELAKKFPADKIVFAKVDVNDHKSFMKRYDIQGYPTIMFFDGNSDTPEKYEYGRELDFMMDWVEEKTSIKPSDNLDSELIDVPPPINLATKPKPMMSGQNGAQHVAQNGARSQPVPAARTDECLLCRDFSGPDGVAAQYPRQNLPRVPDVTAYLAQVLCDPFPSHTDKARAIFTWCHHNLAYDTVAFFGKKIKHVEPKDNISSGLAVCGGYAGVYEAIALHAGLECVMVVGHGKGYGHEALKPGEPIPPVDPAGHAWNAVRIDNGEWKLLDACWGAGNVANEVYTKHFKPAEFTMSNEEMGLKHFPNDERYFFRADGRIPTWEEYYIGPTQEEPLQLFGIVQDHGLLASSFSPPQKRIPVHSNEIIRFQFSKMCEHWDHERNGKGKPYCFVMKICGKDGRKEDWVPFEKNDFWWYVDIPARDLGAPGQKITLYTVTTVNGKDMRGMTAAEYLRKKGRCAMGFAGVAAWDLV